VTPADRSISVTAVMKPVTGTQKMSIRFELLKRTKPGVGYSQVRGGDLGTWISPLGQPDLGKRPGDVWVVSHPVAALPAPATYRYRVSFRWIGAKGHVLATRTRTSEPCYQPELRPDLEVRSISVSSGAVTLYSAVIHNRGATDAPAFSVAFDPGNGASVRTRFLQHGLASHKTATVTFRGPVCALSALAPIVTADPAPHQVDDFNLSNNSLRATCP
jgi:hypothetical protein